MGRKKKDQTFFKSIRVGQDTKEFLESLPNANLFVLQLLQDTEDFKKFKRKKQDMEDQPKLF